MQSTRFDPDVGVTGSEETPAPHAPRTAFKSVRSAGSREYAVASGMLVDASLKGARGLWRAARSGQTTLRCSCCKLSHLCMSMCRGIALQ